MENKAIITIIQQYFSRKFISSRNEKNKTNIHE